MVNISDFAGENSVAVLNDLQMKGTEHMLWPCNLAACADKLVKDALPPVLI